MSDLNETVLASLPLVLIITALAAAVLFFPENMDIRQRASEPTPIITQATLPLTPAYQLEPENICSELYSPVCGSDGVTYDSACEAQMAGAGVIYASACVSPQP